MRRRPLALFSIFLQMILIIFASSCHVMKEGEIDLYLDPNDVSTTAELSLAAGQSKTIDEDVSTSITLSSGVHSEGADLSYSLVTPPSHGTLRNCLTLNASTNIDLTCDYLSDSDYSGLDSFVYAVSDGSQTKTAIVAITVTAVNDVPILSIPSDYVFGGANSPILQGTASTFNSSAIDPESDPITFSCTYESVGLDAGDPNFAAGLTTCDSLESLVSVGGVLQKSFVVFDSATGDFSWNPTSTQRGTFKFTISADDGTDTSSSSFYVTVIEDLVTSNLVLNLDALYSLDQAGSLLGLPALPRLDSSAEDDLSDWFDLTSNANNMSLASFGSPTPWVGDGTATNPYALFFNSTNSDAISIPQTPSLDITGQEIAVDLWLKSSTPANTQILISNEVQGGGGASDKVQFSAMTNNVYFHTSESGTWESLSTTTAPFQANNWYHFTGTLGPSGKKIYVNGRQAASTAETTTLAATTRNWDIGADLDSGTLFLNGSIAQTRIYSADLTKAEVQQNFSSQANRFRTTPIEDIVSDSLVLHFDAANAHDGLRPHDNTGCTTDTIFNLGSMGNNASMEGPFGCTTSSGFAGTGIATDPYRVVFDGVNDAIYYLSSSLGMADNWTIEIWYKSTAGAIDDALVQVGDSLTNGETNALKINTDYVYMANSAGAYFKYYRAFPVNTAWTHMTVSWDAGTLLIYQNGTDITPTVTKQVDNAGSMADTAHKVRFGLATNDGVTSVNQYTGAISVVRFYNRTLTPEEISQNCLAQKDRFDGAICNGL